MRAYTFLAVALAVLLTSPLSVYAKGGSGCYETPAECKALAEQRSKEASEQNRKMRAEEAREEKARNGTAFEQMKIFSVERNNIRQEDEVYTAAGYSHEFFLTEKQVNAWLRSGAVKITRVIATGETLVIFYCSPRTSC